MADERELNGWGEIASFLRVSVRTAQNYEHELGLPVHRLPGAKRRVFAHASALEAWKHNTKEVSPPDTQAPATPETTTPRRPRPLAAMALLALALTSLAAWLWTRRAGPASGFTVTGRTLTVYDDQKRVKWRHEFPTFPDPIEDGDHPKALFSDFTGTGNPATLFLYYPADSQGRHTANYSAQLCYFNDNGRLIWSQTFGTEFRTPKGRFYPASLYTVNLLGRLHKPRPDGGVIVAGGYHGGTWVYEIEIYTATGKKVGSYLHPGWLYAMQIEDLNGDGVDEILLGGVNNGYEESGYAAALVVLDSRRITGQGASPPGDDRQATGMPTGTEAASILISDFAPKPDENSFCVVHQLAAAAGIVELKVTQQRPELPFVYYRFDRQLRLTHVQPELNFEAKLVEALPKPVTNADRNRFLLKRLGALKVLRNEFDPARPSQSPP
jgi:hypothetical protein